MILLRSYIGCVCLVLVATFSFLSPPLYARYFVIDEGKQSVFGEQTFTLIEHSTSDESFSRPSYTQISMAPGDTEYVYAATLTHGVIAYRYQVSDKVEGGFEDDLLTAVSGSVFESTRNPLNGKCNEGNPGRSPGDSCHGAIGMAFHYDPDAINAQTGLPGKVFMYLAPTVVLHNSGGSDFFQNIIRLSDDDGDRIWGETQAEGNTVDEVRQVIAESLSVAHHQIQHLHVSGNSLFISLGSRGDTQTNEHAYTAAVLFIENLLKLEDTASSNIAWFDIGGDLDPDSFGSHAEYLSALRQEHDRDIQVFTSEDTGKIRSYAQGLRNPFGLAADSQGSLYTTMHAVNDASSINFRCPNPTAEDGTPRDQFYQLIRGTDYGCPKRNSAVGDWRDEQSAEPNVIVAQSLGLIETDPSQQGRPVLMLEYNGEKIPPSGIDFVTAAGSYFQSVVMGSWSEQNAVFLLNQTGGTWALDQLISSGPHQPQSTKFLNGILDIFSDSNGDLLMASHRGERGGLVGSGIWYVDIEDALVANQAPIFIDASIKDHTVQVGDSFSFFPSWHDGDEQDTVNMVFSIVNAPEWLVIDSRTGEISGTPSCSDLGATNGIHFEISDGIATNNSKVFSMVVEGAQCGLKIEHGVLTNVTSNWQTVTLENHYDNMVVVATPVYTSAHVATVPRIRNAQGNTFQVMAQDVMGNGSTVSVSLTYIVVEQGVYTEQSHGVKMEAQRVTSSLTGQKGNWEAEDRQMLNAEDYVEPVVIGQVMTYNDSNFSHFWSASESGIKDLGLPVEAAFVAGKGISINSGSRLNEQLGLIVVEAGTYVVSGMQFTAAVGPDLIEGMRNSGESLYPTAVGSHAIASIMGVDGRDGGWLVLNGDPGSPTGSLSLKVDESGTGRKHGSAERAGYILFH
ncbi:putative Ig domain-containing protein [Microbulbifer sp. CnH-101-G]|uniref:putative Ig domain-containing protein n=1 Tax=Microbulbifer sp. CnH-101-G TaxID=3243393 RepID=UPI004039AB80